MPESSCPSALQTCRSLVSLFNCRYSSRSEEVSHYASTCNPLMTNNAAYLSCIGNLCIFFCKMLVHVFINLCGHICWKDFLPPWKCLRDFVKNNWLCTKSWLFFIFYSISWIYLSILMLVPYYFYSSNFKKSLNQIASTPTFLFFFKAVLDI